ncbi:hypothetical protein PM082_023547 [Marasmius tenuissimus]|nr:hypothetical protein PM082_023547 [Marasmius tenuissimus]
MTATLTPPFAHARILIPKRPVGRGAMRNSLFGQRTTRNYTIRVPSSDSKVHDSCHTLLAWCHCCLYGTTKGFDEFLDFSTRNATKFRAITEVPRSRVLLSSAIMTLY